MFETEHRGMLYRQTATKACVCYGITFIWDRPREQSLSQAAVFFCIHRCTPDLMIKGRSADHQRLATVETAVTASSGRAMGNMRSRAET
jgi:hypothetical protein